MNEIEELKRQLNELKEQVSVKPKGAVSLPKETLGKLLFTRSGAAREIGVSVSSLWKMVKEGRITPTIVEPEIVFDYPTLLAAYINNYKAKKPVDKLPTDSVLRHAFQ